MPHSAQEAKEYDGMMAKGMLIGTLLMFWLLETDPREDLRLSLSVDSSNATIGGELQLDVSLENTGNAPIEVSEFAFEERSLDFEVTFSMPRGGNRTFLDSIVRADPDLAKRLPLQRNMLRSGHALKTSHRLPLFSTGPVTVRALYHGAGGPLRSEATTVQVQPRPDHASRLSVMLETTQGNLQMRLYPEESPANVANFIRLSRGHFYSPMLFFQILKDDWIKSGGPYDLGCGSPGYTLHPEPPPVSDAKDRLAHEVGTVSMAANLATGNSGSQYVIELRSHPQFEGKYPIIGVLTPESIGIARKISELAVEPGTTASRIDVSVERLTVTIVPDPR